MVAEENKDHLVDAPSIGDVGMKRCYSVLRGDTEDGVVQSL